MRTEKVFSAIFLLGIIFKLMLWPGYSILLIISLMGIGMIYFPGAFYFFCDKVIKRQNLTLSIVSGFLLSLIPIGILFKIQYWSGGQLYLLIGTITAPIIMTIVLFLKSKAAEDLSVYYKNMFSRTLVLSVLTALFYLTPTSTLLKIQYRSDPELARLKTLYYENPDNEEYKKQHDEYLSKKK